MTQMKKETDITYRNIADLCGQATVQCNAVNIALLEISMVSSQKALDKVNAELLKLKKYEAALKGLNKPDASTDMALVSERLREVEGIIKRVESRQPTPKAEVASTHNEELNIKLMNVPSLCRLAVKQRQEVTDIIAAQRKGNFDKDIEPARQALRETTTMLQTRITPPPANDQLLRLAQQTIKENSRVLRVNPLLNQLAISDVVSKAKQSGTM